MACPFSAFYAQKSAADNPDEVKNMARSKNCPSEGRSGDYPSSDSRKASVTLTDTRFQHQGSFSASFGQTPFGARDEATCVKRESQSRIVWERGPSLDHLKSASGVGVVQQRVHSFSQQWNKPDNSATRSAISGADGALECGGIRPARRSRGFDDRPLLKNPMQPLDPKEPLSLRNLTEAVWSFITIPVSLLSLNSFSRSDVVLIAFSDTNTTLSLVLWYKILN